MNVPPPHSLSYWNLSKRLGQTYKPLSTKNASEDGTVGKRFHLIFWMEGMGVAEGRGFESLPSESWAEPGRLSQSLVKGMETLGGMCQLRAQVAFAFQGDGLQWLFFREQMIQLCQPTPSNPGDNKWVACLACTSVSKFSHTSHWLPNFISCAIFVWPWIPHSEGGEEVRQ